MSQSAENEITAFRGEKDAYFRDDPDSPISADKRTNFKGLNYYSPDPTYRVKARLDRYDRPEPTMVVTSKGTKQAYMKHGTFTFQLQGAKLRLFVYKSAEDPFARSLFIPFSDETSGSETYKAGTYLDLEEQGGDDYELDLNLATIHTAHTTISTRVPSRQEKISYPSRFSQERRTTSRRILGYEVDNNDGQDSRPLGGL